MTAPGRWCNYKPFQHIEFDDDAAPDEYYNQITVTWGELRDYGFIDWDDPSWHWDFYDVDQFQRMQKKFDGRWWTREIGIIPPGDWKRRFIGKLNELAPKYKLIYDRLKTQPDPLALSDERYKERHVFSEYPATQLGGDNQDYASTGDDRQYERIMDGNITDTANDYYDRYRDADAAMMDELEVLFSSIVTAEIGGF